MSVGGGLASGWHRGWWGGAVGDSERCFESVDRAFLRPGLRVAHLGDERLVLDSAAGIVHAVRGPAVAALDRVLSGRRPVDDEVLAALVGAGIAETSGLSRREALALSTSALALIASTTLPSAAAAASTASLSATDPSSGTVTEYVLQDGARLYRLVNLSFSFAATQYTFTPSASTTVDVLLVAGGGAGGEPGDRTVLEFFGGGGGGGEVAYTSLVSDGAELSFEVAGYSAGIGGASILTRGPDSVTAAGGGRGAARIGSTLTAASAGGSGGGGTAGAIAGGAAGSGAVSGLIRTSYANAGGGGTGSHRAAAGGGGAAAAAVGVGAASTENGGGNGGNGRTLDVTGWNLTGSGAPSAQTFGSGGGGAGIATAGVSDVGGEAGRGATTTDAGFIVFARDGALGTGSGGGGGMLVQGGSAFAGFGGSGVIWVRTS